MVWSRDIKLWIRIWFGIISPYGHDPGPAGCGDGGLENLLRRRGICLNGVLIFSG